MGVFERRRRNQQGRGNCGQKLFEDDFCASLGLHSAGR